MRKLTKYHIKSHKKQKKWDLVMMHALLKWLRVLVLTEVRNPEPGA